MRTSVGAILAATAASYRLDLGTAHVDVGLFERLATRARALAALTERIDTDFALGEDAGLTAELSALVAEHPARERFTAQLMRVLHRSGRAVHRCA